MVVATTFWESFFLLLIFLPLAMIWVFALFDIFRRDDIGGGWKAVWVACVILVPFFGTLAYLVVRPAGVTADERMLRAEARRVLAAESAADATSQLQALADLHDRGKLTDDEFAAEKARVLGSDPSAPA
jgi:hypothetical protein